MALKPKELKELTKEELIHKSETLRKELYGLRTQVRSGRVDKPHKIGETRKDLARVLTILNQKDGKTKP